MFRLLRYFLFEAKKIVNVAISGVKSSVRSTVKGIQGAMSLAEADGSGLSMGVGLGEVKTVKVRGGEGLAVSLEVAEGSGESVGKLAGEGDGVGSVRDGGNVACDVGAAASYSTTNV